MSRRVGSSLPCALERDYDIGRNRERAIVDRFRRPMLYPTELRARKHLRYTSLVGSSLGIVSAEFHGGARRDQSLHSLEEMSRGLATVRSEGADQSMFDAVAEYERQPVGINPPHHRPDAERGPLWRHDLKLHRGPSL